jgi:uncharacterized membrane protein
VQAIRDAEAKTSGQIRVYVQRGKVLGDPMKAAQERFHRLGMHATPERNAVLIFVAPRTHKLAVIGDKGIHEKCGAVLWERLIHRMRGDFQTEEFSHAIVEAIKEIGIALATHFPRKSTSTNELPDDVIEG